MDRSRQLAALPAVLIIVVALAGCGATAKAQPASTHPASSAVFVSLHAVRSSAFPSNDIPAFDYMGADPAAIAKLYDTIAALKPYPANADYFCPVDRGLLYHLTFTRADGSRVTGEAKPDGCAYASLNGGAGGEIDNWDAFWLLFADALGVAPSALDLSEP